VATITYDSEDKSFALLGETGWQANGFASVDAARSFADEYGIALAPDA